MKNIYPTVDGIAKKYWIGYPSYEVDAIVKKTASEIWFLRHALGDIKGKTLIDVGGGWGIFAASCSSLGMNVMLLDDFGDGASFNLEDPRHNLSIDFGFTAIKRDIIFEGLNNPPESVDAVTSFDMIEHLHASPKDFLHDAMKVLRQDGVLFLGVPNCVNLRKRLTVPFGRGSWSHFSDWYEPKIFRGHVREPDIQDLIKIAQDISLNDYKIFGRNWQGYISPSKIIRLSTKIANKILMNFPSLCSDIYLLGFKR